MVLNGAKILRLNRVCKYYKDLTVLNELDLELNAAQMVALIAPSGSGKSTLLHIAGLLEKPDAGHVLIHDNDVSTLADAIRTKIRGQEIGFVYQAHHLLAEFSALENVMMPLLLANKTSKLAKERAYKLLKYLGLKEKIYNKPSELSGGQQQRVAIARALVNAPSILLADEPTGNLDPTTSNNVFAIFAHMVRELGLAALIATHNYSLASQMDRILTLKNGRLVELT